MKAIELENVKKIIKGRVVLKDISLALDAGKVYGFYGHNGSGKSMLFRAIAGLIKPTIGKVTVFGKEIGRDTSFPEDMGLIIEAVGFWPYFTGFENLQTLASIRGLVSDEDIRTVLLKVGLDPKDKRAYSKYSLGMKQRLGIAQAIMERPKLLLLDEPTNALDENGINLFRSIIAEETAKGTTTLITSHHKEELARLCTRFFKMCDGQISEEMAGIEREN